MDNLNGYNQDWSLEDMIMFNRIAIDESEVDCLWTGNQTYCYDRIKVKDFKAHLHHKHGITSDSQLYACRWYECSGQPMKRSSLERHMKEQHVSLKWACPHCTQTFTRHRTMMDHIRRTPGHA